MVALHVWKSHKKPSPRTLEDITKIYDDMRPSIKSQSGRKEKLLVNQPSAERIKVLQGWMDAFDAKLSAGTVTDV